MITVAGDRPKQSPNSIAYKAHSVTACAWKIKVHVSPFKTSTEGSGEDGQGRGEVTAPCNTQTHCGHCARFVLHTMTAYDDLDRAAGSERRAAHRGMSCSYTLRRISWG